MIDTSSGHDRVGRTLEAAGVAPSSILRVHHLLTLPETLVRSQSVAIMPRRVAAAVEKRWPLRSRPVDHLLEDFRVRLFANAALHPTAARRWFLELLADAVQSFAADAISPMSGDDDALHQQPPPLITPRR